MNQQPLGIADIMQRLPHRHPFLLLDRVLQHGGDVVVALKNVTVNEAFFSGHFPSVPIMPGVLIGECMAQSAAFLGLERDAQREGGDGGNAAPDAATGAVSGAVPDKVRSATGGKAMLASMNLKLQAPVVPGDQLLLTTRLIKRIGSTLRVAATATVDERQVACAELTLVLR